jgi:hypothetical protein
MSIKTAFCAAILSAFVSLSAPGVSFAGDKAAKAAAKPAASDVTLTGTMVCGKCGLKETKSCQNVLKVTEGGKEVKYYLADNDVAKGNHGQVCGGTAEATVKGSVAKKDGKNVLTASEIAYKE